MDKTEFAKRVANDPQARQKFLQSLSKEDIHWGIQQLQQQLSSYGSKMQPQEKTGFDELLQTLDGLAKK